MPMRLAGAWHGLGPDAMSGTASLLSQTCSLPDQLGRAFGPGFFLRQGPAARPDVEAETTLGPPAA